MKAIRAITRDRGSPAALGVHVAAEAGVKRFEITLLIRHPTLNPDMVTSALALQPHRSWKSGESRFTPKGQPLPGNHTTSSWNHVFSYSGKEGFSAQICSILDHLAPQKTLLRKIDRTGGRTELYLKLPGDQNFGDELTWDILERFAELRVGFSLETFPDWK
jgi:hypothetical protein